MSEPLTRLDMLDSLAAIESRDAAPPKPVQVAAAPVAPLPERVTRVATVILRNVYDPETGAITTLEFESTVPFDRELQKMAELKANALPPGYAWAQLDINDAVRVAQMARICVQITSRNRDYIAKLCANPAIRAAVEALLVNHELRFFRLAVGVGEPSPILPNVGVPATPPSGQDAR